MISKPLNPTSVFSLLFSSLSLLVISLLTFSAVAGHHNKDDSAEKHGHAEMSGKAMPSDIVSVAMGAGQFNTLAAALTAADLVATLQSDGPFTVFAPTDAAFAKLPKGTVDSLLLPENKQKLVSILTYHVVPGKVTSGDVVKLTEATSVNGKKLNINVMGDKVKVNDSNVTAVDIKASNGVIHVIDSVMLP